MDPLGPWNGAGPLGTLAYIDAGSAAIVLQALLAGVAGLVLFLKLQGRRVLGFFGRGPKDEDSAAPKDE